jgi:hypothetical protein
MSNSSGLVEQLVSSNDVQGDGKTVLAVVDAGINEVAKLVPPLGTAIGIVEGILSLVNPSSNSGPTMQDLQNQIQQFAQTVEAQLTALQAQLAGGQVADHATALEQVLTNPNGSLSIVGELPAWQNSPGLPLPDQGQAKQYQIYARSALLSLLGGGNAPGATSRPTSYWWLPAGDLPLFKPQNPWTYNGTSNMFNQRVMSSLGPNGYLPDDLNPYTDTGTTMPQFDLSDFNFTNDFSPTNVAGVGAGNAVNPTWVLQQTMAAVYYYLLICGAVLQNFPNDGSTIPDFVGTYDFAGNLLWYHDQIRAGIVNIPPPFPWDLVPFDANGLIPSSADGGVSAWSVPCALNGTSTGNVAIFYGNDTAANAPASDWSRPFGALCNYTGYVANYGGNQPSVDNYPDYVYPTPGQPGIPPPTAQLSEDVGTFPASAPPQWYIGFYSKYLVATLWRTKLVYLGLGLADMWHTINNLYAMCGQAPQPGPCFGDWSLRAVFKMLGSANLASFPLPAQPESNYLPKFTVRGFLQFMNGAAPTPQARVTSLRAALQA